MKKERIDMVIRMDTALKKQADALFKELGLDLPTAIDIFLRQSIRENGFPFLIQKRDFGEEPQSREAKKRFTDAPIRAETHEVTIIASGISGGVTWRIDAEGTLTLSPTDDVRGTMDSLVGVYSGSPWYSYRSRIKKAIAEPGVALGKNACSLFSEHVNLVEVDLNNLDVSSVTNMYRMFYGCHKLTTLEGLAKWQTGNVDTMAQMFYGCSNLVSLEGLAKWQTGNVWSMAQMFYGCSNLVSLEGLANWCTGSVANMSYMFYGCCSLPSLKSLAGWDMGSVKNMSCMFEGCCKLYSLNGLANWQTANVRDMSYMFSWCGHLTSLKPLAEWDTGNVTDVRYMFHNCRNLASLEGLAGWDMGKVRYMTDMFSGCSRLTSLKLLANWQTRKVGIMDKLFNNCGKVEAADFSNWIFPPSIYFREKMFSGCSSLSEITISDSITFDGTNLPGPQETDVYTGNWTYGDPYNHNPDDVLSGEEFASGTHKAGTWHWERKGTKA